jgi:hypothetical protein
MLSFFALKCNKFIAAQLNWLENKKKCGAVNMIGLTYFVCTGKIFKTGGEIGCSGMEINSCSTSATRRVALVTNSGKE